MVLRYLWLGSGLVKQFLPIPQTAIAIRPAWTSQTGT